MLTVLSRILQYGWKNFVRNGLLSTATVAIVTLALLMFLGLIVFNVITEKTVASIQDKIDITASFNTTTPEDEILNIKQSLESLDEVKSVEYVSRDQALTNFQARHKNDQDIAQALRELGENPLEASLNIKAKRSDQYGSIAEYLNNPTFAPYISHVSYAENEVAINRLNAIINNVNRLGFLTTIILILVSGLVVFNTVRLAIYSNRDEISIMRAVGASNSFVRGPFVVEGVAAGAIAALLSIIIAIPGIHSLAPYVSEAVPDMNLLAYFYGRLPLLLLYQILAGVLVSGVSSFVAVRRYLHN